MKSKVFNLTLVSVSAALAVAGCKMFGANPTPPTYTEAHLFDITTNSVPQVVFKTNVVDSVNIVTVTNAVGVAVLTTNFFNSTNVVTTTNQVMSYDYQPKTETVATIQAVGAVSSPFTAGWGTMVGSALIGLYGLWAHLRSTKSTNTSLALTQEIEAIRDFILTLPQGAKIDTAVTTFMQQHQTEAGVAQQVLSLIEGNSSNATVTGVAAELQTLINTLTAPPKA
jgi:hypothetical protein